MEKKIVMSGMRPTQGLHLGNWQGALKSWLELQNKFPCFFSIVDWHALTTEYQLTGDIKTHVEEVLLDWLSAGIDPDKSTIYLQSAIKEIAELFLILAMVTPLGWLERVPTFKEQQLELKDRDLNTYGFLGYPLLQTADIIIVKGNVVPVGEDQVYHIELAREIVRRFNSFYGQCFPEPKEYLTPVAKLPGIDGRKMSKTYNNAIYLSESAESVEKKLLPMVTDTRRKKRTDPGEPEDCPVFAFQKAFSSAEEIQGISSDCQSAGIGCIDCKKVLIRNINDFLQPFRERRQKFSASDLKEILDSGNKRVAEIARQTLNQVRELVKV